MCKGTNCAECNARTHRDSPVQSSLAPLAYMSSVSFRYWIISTMLVRTNPCCLAKRFISGRRIISVGLSSETISHSTPARERPARCARSTPASVCFATLPCGTLPAAKQYTTQRTPNHNKQATQHNHPPHFYFRPSRACLFVLQTMYRKRFVQLYKFLCVVCGNDPQQCHEVTGS